MMATPETGLHDPADAMRWQSLAVLLGSLRTTDARDRFATLYRREAGSADAEEALSGLLEAAATLWAREERAAAACTSRVPDAVPVG